VKVACFSPNVRPRLTALVLESFHSAPVANGNEGKIVVVGASHMYRMAEYLPANSISPAYLRFKPLAESIVSIKEKLDAFKLSASDTVVLDLLSNSAYMGTDVNGLPSPAERAGDGRYHILGSLTTAPPTILKKVLEVCNTLAEKVKQSNVLLVCPIPRYVMGSCCTDPTHIENRNSEEFEDELADCLEQHKKVLGRWAVAMGLRFCLLDPTAVVHPTEPLLRNRLTSDGISIWCPGDPVHLSQEAYRDLAHALIEVHDDDQDDAGSVSSRLTGDKSALRPGSVAHSSSSGKRKLPDAVVTDQRSVSYKRGPVTRVPVAAGWLRGVSSATNDSDVRKRDRHGNPSARGVGWRGGCGRGGRGSWPWSGRARSGRRWQF
jgi:hypothetical protein